MEEYAMFAVLHPRNGREWNVACLEPTQRTGWTQHKIKERRKNDRKRKQVMIHGNRPVTLVPMPKKTSALSSGLHPTCRSLPVWETLLLLPFWAFFSLFLHLSLSLFLSFFISLLLISSPSSFHRISFVSLVVFELVTAIGLP